MKRVLFVSHSAELNGAERFLLATLEGLDRGAVTPVLLMPKPGPLGEAAAASGVEVMTARYRWWLSERGGTLRQAAARAANVPAILRASRRIRRQPIDAVFSNSAAVSVGALAARRTGRPHIWFVHEILDGPDPLLRYARGQRRLAAFIARRSAVILASSNAAARAFQPFGGARVVYNGIRVDPGTTVSRSDARRALGLPESDFVIGMLGKVQLRKAQREGLLAAAALRARRPDVRVVIAGAIGDARYLGELRRTAGELGLHDRVDVLGWRPDAARVLAALDALLVPSVQESFGRAALEAMAAGTPVVAVASGGILELVSDGETGVLASSARPDELAAALGSIADDPGRAREIARRARAEVRARFSLEAQAAGIAAALEDALGR